MRGFFVVKARESPMPAQPIAKIKANNNIIKNPSIPPWNEAPNKLRKINIIRRDKIDFAPTATSLEITMYHLFTGAKNILSIKPVLMSVTVSNPVLPELMNMETSKATGA